MSLLLTTCVTLGKTFNFLSLWLVISYMGPGSPASRFPPQLAVRILGPSLPAAQGCLA